MSKRKDNKGRVLREGESQRKDLMYRYRYTDKNGKRVSVYSKDLHELRKIEEEIKRSQMGMVSYAEGSMTTVDLVRLYIRLKKGVSNNTRDQYDYVLSKVESSSIGRSQIKKVTSVEAKLFFQEMQANGLSYNTICSIRGVMRPAFEMAYEESIINRNPFSFSLSSVVVKDTKKRIPLTLDEQERLLNFLTHDTVYRKQYDMIVFMLGTGLRAGELCGLTIPDIDLKKRVIKIDHQLIMNRDRSMEITSPKTEQGIRNIPMSDAVYSSLLNHLEWRAKNIKTEYIVDGYSRFVFCQDNGKPQNVLGLDKKIKRIWKKYQSENPTKSMPVLTPHVFRHTFCTNLANAGMSIKSLQYVMGHSDVSTTMNIYAHESYQKVVEEMGRIQQLQAF